MKNIRYVKFNNRFDDEKRILIIRSHEVGQAAVNGSIDTDWSLKGGKCLHTEAHDRDHDTQHR